MPQPQTTATTRRQEARRNGREPGAVGTAGDPPASFYDHLARLERARRGRLRSLWQMSAEQRIAAMRRGELTLEQLAAWSARHPDEIPRLNGEFEWLAVKTPEVCE